MSNAIFEFTSTSYTDGFWLAHSLVTLLPNTHISGLEHCGRSCYQMGRNSLLLVVVSLQLSVHVFVDIAFCSIALFGLPLIICQFQLHGPVIPVMSHIRSLDFSAKSVGISVYSKMQVLLTIQPSAIWKYVSRYQQSLHFSLSLWKWHPKMHTVILCLGDE